MLIFISFWQLLHRWGLLLLVGVLALNVLADVHAQPTTFPVEMLSDAELHAIQFVDPDHGWAVGDRGAIWQTQDGGRTWRQQISPVACRLDEICFVNEQQGWAVGGWTHPYTQRTIGVVLRTENGGRQWTAVPGLTVPALRAVHFVDARRGWAAGDGSALYPTGIYWTENAGREWTPLPKCPADSWTAAAFTSDGKFAIAGASGKTAHGSLVGAEYSRAESETQPNQTAPFLGITLDSRGSGWLVGPHGTIRRTTDGGRSWRNPQGSLPAFTKQFDFNSVAMRGSHAWIVGSPGTLVFHTADDGASWEAFPTDRATPLTDIAFLDEQRGWAVGSLGSILATRDGGQTWLLQRSGGSRAALVGMFSEIRRVPWEWFASAAGNDGYLSTIEILTSGSSPGSGELFRNRSQVHEALVTVGGCSADQNWNLPTPPEPIASTTAVQEFWQQTAGPQAAAHLEERIVQRLRQWRPEVVLTEDVSPRGEYPLGHLTNQIVLAAVQKAADPTAYPEQISLLGLEPWAAKKVVAPRPGEARGTFTLSPAQLAPRLGKSIGEAAEAGRSLVSSQMQIDPSSVAAAVLVDALPQGLGRQDLFSGMSLRPESDARRRLSETVGGSIESLTRLSQKRHNIQQLIAHTQGNSAQAATWLGQVSSLTSGMSDRSAGEVLFQLGMRYQEAGKWELAAEAFATLVQTHPQHPLTEPAALWLLRYFASAEVAWREERTTKFDVQVAAYDAPEEPLEDLEDEAAQDETGDQKSGPKKKAPPRATTAQLTSASEHATAPQYLEHLHARVTKAAGVAQLLERSRPAFHAEPSVRFPLAATLRHSGSGSLGQRLIDPFAQEDSQVWSRIAAHENWLAAPKENPPGTALQANLAKKPPHLDGRMDDSVWQSSKAVILQAVGNEKEPLPTLVVFAYDQEYLYLAASCRRAADKDYAPLSAPRTHDADLTANDRIEIALDVDRDYAIAWNLAIDHHGRPAESLAGDKTWNPEWFIATSGDDSYWTLEAAIPLQELVAASPKPKDAWAVTVRRVIPRSGTQTLTGKEGTEFSRTGELLIFGE